MVGWGGPLRGWLRVARGGQMVPLVVEASAYNDYRQNILQRLTGF